MQYIQESRLGEPQNLCTQNVMELGKGYHLFHSVSVGASSCESVGKRATQNDLHCEEDKKLTSRQERYQVSVS